MAGIVITIFQMRKGSGSQMTFPRSFSYDTWQSRNRTLAVGVGGPLYSKALSGLLEGRLVEGGTHLPLSITGYDVSEGGSSGSQTR